MHSKKKIDIKRFENCPIKCQHWSIECGVDAVDLMGSEGGWVGLWSWKSEQGGDLRVYFWYCLLQVHCTH